MSVRHARTSRCGVAGRQGSIHVEAGSFVKPPAPLAQVTSVGARPSSDTCEAHAARGRRFCALTLRLPQFRTIMTLFPGPRGRLWTGSPVALPAAPALLLVPMGFRHDRVATRLSPATAFLTQAGAFVRRVSRHPEQAHRSFVVRPCRLWPQDVDGCNQ